MVSLARAMPKSQTLTSPSKETQEIRRGHVAVDDAEWTACVVGTPVGVVEPPQRFANDVDSELEGQRHLGARAAPQERVEVEPLDILHRDEEAFSVTSEVEHLDDVRMVQASGELRLVHEHLAEARVARQSGKDLLDHAQARGAELHLLAGQVNFRHPALADEIEQDIASEAARQGRACGNGRGGHERGWSP